jgi:diacylglycerol kinase family enzyme
MQSRAGSRKLGKAGGQSVATSDVCVIFNPTAGRRRLADHLQRFRHLLGNGFEPRPTQSAGHAEALAFEAAQEGFGVVAAAGGDGTVHEVANGLLRANRPGVVLRVVPIGSANDYADSLELQQGCRRATNQNLKVRRVDVGLAVGEDGRQRYFVNGLGLGFNGAVTMESRKIRHLRGVPLYSLALLRALCYQFYCPEMSVSIDGQERKAPTLALTVNIGRREGNFVMAPDARLDDGLFDYLQAGRLKRWELLRFLPAIITGRLPTNHPQIWTGRCKEVRVRSQEPLIVHLDGEFFCLPKDGILTIDVRILPGALPVLAPNGK